MTGTSADEPAYGATSPSRPGYGRSTFQPNRTFHDWPRDVTSLADVLGVAEFGVTGHSGAGHLDVALWDDIFAACAVHV